MVVQFVRCICLIRKGGFCLPPLPRGEACMFFELFCVCEWFGKLVGKGAVLAGVSCKTADLALLASEN